MGKVVGDEIVLNTTKLIITNSHVADVYVIMGIVDGHMQSVIVGKGMKGLVTGQLERKPRIA
jgi:alkylation response protein AidB-like acyl-CoA dehydrogenase